MGLGVGIIRGLGVVCLVLAGVVLGAAPAIVPTGAAYAQSVNSIVVEGNRKSVV